ncbi:MAG: hypothetical protein JW982_08000 [Spirochaetes bacterium]|nr:hypothetical protein [Spirochaetota bacterium]
MEISSHYYGILALCLSKNVKFEIAKRIAFASFYVDDAKTDVFIFDRKYKDPLFDNKESFSRLLNVSTCHAYQQLKSFNYHSMVTATVPFHYFPGCQGENFDKKLRCKPNPPVLEKMIRKTAAEKTFNPEKFGMLLHVYADTFSHQGFSGLLSTVNDISEYRPGAWYDRVFNLTRKISSSGFEKLFDYVMPAYGHMQVFFSPDNPSEKWSYRYDAAEHCTGDIQETRIDNCERYSEAFKAVSDILDAVKDRTVFNDGRSMSADPAVFDILRIRNISNKNRMEKWCGYIEKFSSVKKENFLYDCNYYLKSAISNFSEKKFKDRVVRNISLKDGYEKSDWYRFISAVVWYKKEFFQIMLKNGIRIPH